MKTVSKSSAQSGDVLTYTITLNVTGLPQTNVKVTDVIPGQMSYVSAGITPAGGSFMPNGNNLSWSWGSLAVGTYSLTYQVKVNSLVPQGTILTNNAQLNYAGLITPKTTSVSVTVIGSYMVKIDVYNEAGELVKEVYSQELSQPANSVSLSNSTITSLESPVTILVSGQAVTVWDGTSSSQTPVSNGNYYIKVQSTDPYGVTTTVSQVVTVSRQIATIQVDIFNEAGEVIRHLYAYQNDANNTQLTNFQLSAGVLSIGNDQPGSGGASSQATIVLSTGVTMTWDGRNDSGALVTGGHYEIEVHFNSGKGQQSVVAKGILVQNDQNSPTNGKIYAKPNILNGTTQTTLVVKSSLNLSLDVRVYDVAGEMVWGGVLTSASNNNQFSLPLPPLSSGLYYVVAELTDTATGHNEGHQVTQIVIQR